MQLTIRSEFVIDLPPAQDGDESPLLASFPPRIGGIEELAAVPYRQFTSPVSGSFIGAGAVSSPLIGKISTKRLPPL